MHWKPQIWEYLQELRVSFYISAEKHILTSLFSRRFFSWQENFKEG